MFNSRFRDIRLKTRRYIPCLCTPICYSLFILVSSTMIITAPLVWFKLEDSYPCLTEITSLTSFLQGVPWCFFPKSYLGGYKIDGEVRETQLGYRATLNRHSNTTIYGDDIDEIVLDVEFQTDDRVRFKVMNELIWFRWACDKLCSNFKTCSGYTWLAWQEISNQISSRHCVFFSSVKIDTGLCLLP